MKKLFCAIVAVFVVVSANAQVKFGVKAGIDFSKIGISASGMSVSTSSSTGFNAGFIAEIPVATSFFIQPGLSIVQKGGVIPVDNYEASIKPIYLELPVNAMYKFALGESAKFLIFAGPYLAYGIGGTAKDDTESATIKFGSDGDMKAFDFGLNFGPGIEYKNFQLTAQYSLGLSNIVNGSGDGSAKNKGFSISIAYLFGGK
jgi:hypothetical protein